MEVTKLILMEDTTPQPLDLILKDYSVDPLTQNYKKKQHNFQAIRDTVQQLTEHHFSKLYEHIYLESKPLSREIVKITREHFIKNAKKVKRIPDSPARLPVVSKQPKLVVRTSSRVSRGLDRVNQSLVEKSSEGIVAQSRRAHNSFIRNASIDKYNESPILEEKVIDSTELINENEPPSIQIVDDKTSIPTKSKLILPKILTTLKEPILESQSKGPKPGYLAKNLYALGSKRNLASATEEQSPNTGKWNLTPGSTMNAPNDLKSKEKNRENSKKRRNEDLFESYKSEPIKLIRLLLGDDKTSLEHLQITRDQLKSHLLKRYPIEITERFLQVMDFPSNIPAKAYINYFKNVFTESLDISYFLCFKLFDFNDDEIINHRDLFTLFKLMDQYPFLKYDFNQLLYKPPKQVTNKLAVFTKKNILNNTGLMSVATSNSQEKNFSINKNMLALKVSLLKTLESMISKQDEQRIVNLTQLRMVHQTELNTFLNYKRGKYKDKSWFEMINSNLNPQRPTSKGSLGPMTPSHAW